MGRTTEANIGYGYVLDLSNIEENVEARVNFYKKIISLSDEIKKQYTYYNFHWLDRLWQNPPIYPSKDSSLHFEIVDLASLHEFTLFPIQDEPDYEGFEYSAIVFENTHLYQEVGRTVYGELPEIPKDINKLTDFINYFDLEIVQGPGWIFSAGHF